MKFNSICLISVFLITKCFSAPLQESRDMLFVPIRSYSIIEPRVPFPQIRGPLDFIGNWIQSSDWFPIEINVPDTFANIGNGVSTFATNVGSGFNNFAQYFGNGFQSFSQNVGNGIQSFAQNLSQRFPIISVIYRPNGATRYFVLVPTKDLNRQTNTMSGIASDDDILESFP